MTAIHANLSAPVDLKPKEHGAYAILAIPLLTALVIGGLTVAGVSTTVAALAGFFAHEPLLVMLGKRGPRAQRSTPQAKTRLMALGTLSIAFGAIAMLTSSREGQIALVGCLLFAAISFAVACQGQHRSLPGQLWGVLGLSSPAVPVLLAGGVPLLSVLQIWGIYLLGFLATTLAVRGVIASQKQRPRQLHWLVLLSVTAVVGGFIAAGETWPMAALPMVLMSWVLMASPPPARQLKQVGWSLVSVTVLTALLTCVVQW